MKQLFKRFRRKNATVVCSNIRSKGDIVISNIVVNGKEVK